MSNKAPIVTAAATVGVLGGAYLAYKVFVNRSLEEKTKIPTQWNRVGTLKLINVYPIKSCGAIELNNAECTEIGLKDGWLRDRNLMVIDSKNNFITARVYPELLLVSPVIRNAVLTLKHPDLLELNVNLAEVAAVSKKETATVWGVQVPVYDCGKEAKEWFSKLLNRPSEEFRLVYYASQEGRKQRGTTSNKVFNFTRHDEGALPDETSFNLMNEASIAELNTRLKQRQVSHRNYRPNFVIEGPSPYDEDSWKFVKIGENVFEVIKPCLRCVLTTIDPETGVKVAESLETLNSYRQIQDPVKRRAAGSSGQLGLQMGLRSGPGHIAVNDPIYVAL